MSDSEYPPFYRKKLPEESQLQLFSNFLSLAHKIAKNNKKAILFLQSFLET